VILAQMKMATAAIPKRMAAVVKTPNPEKEILIATALDPKRMHKKTVNKPAANVSSSLDGCGSDIKTFSPETANLVQKNCCIYITELILARRYGQSKCDRIITDMFFYAWVIFLLLST
jgi:hypothetical protein